MIQERAGRVCDALLLVFAVALPLSIAASEIALVTALVAWLISAPWKRPVPPGFRGIAIASVALLATWLLASVLAADPVASLARARKLYSIVLVLVLMDRVRDFRAGGRLAVAALAGGAVSAGFGIVDFVIHRLTSVIPDFRLEGVFSTAMTSGNVFATLAIAALGEGFLRRRGGARLAVAAFAMFTLALVATKTRSSWLSFVAGTGVILGARRPRLLVAGLVGIILGIALGPSEVRDRVYTVVDPHYETNAGRISLWRSGLAVVQDHPWTGVGLADHYALIESYRRPDATFHAGHFHNNVVQIAASTGLVGLAGYLAWMSGVLLALLGRLRATGVRGAPRVLVALAVWLAFQIHGLFDWSFGDAEVANQFFFWVGLGLAVAGPSGPPRPGPVRPRGEPGS